VAFFKMASDKNDAFTGKGPSAETTAREEREVAARVEREERHNMDDPLYQILCENNLAVDQVIVALVL
jgi:hypothetical protein